MLRDGPQLASIAARFGTDLILMHSRKAPRDMQCDIHYDDVIKDVIAELKEAADLAISAGVEKEKIWLDPGIGFAKTAVQNVELLARLDELAEIGKPMVIGPSMKSFMGKTLGLEPGERTEATVACCVLAAAKGASIFRVHDVAGVVRALAMTDLILKMGRPMLRSMEA
jgi:dihydropteroate synthase